MCDLGRHKSQRWPGWRRIRWVREEGEGNAVDDKRQPPLTLVRPPSHEAVSHEPWLTWSRSFAFHFVEKGGVGD